MQIVYLKPAMYLKPYPITLADTIAAWKSGKDFLMMPGGPYCSIRDIHPLKMLNEEVILVAKVGGYHSL